MISKSQKAGIWITYLILSPLMFFTFYSLTNTSPTVFNVDFGIFVLIAVLVSLFPMQTEDSVLFFTTGISVATFILFGIYLEMVLTTIAIIAIMIKSNIKLDEHYRYPLNLLLFQFLSVISAFAYYIVQPLNTFSTTYSFILLGLIVYLIIHLIGNQIAMHLINRYLFKEKKTALIDSGFIFLLYFSVFTVPLSFILIYLFETIGISGVVIGALPFLTLIVGLNVFYKNKVNNEYLKKVNVLAHKLTEKRTKQEVIKIYLNSLTSIFPIDELSYFSVTSNALIKRSFLYQKKQNLKKIDEEFFLSHKSVLGKAIEEEEVIYFHRAIDWKQHCEQDIACDAESAIVLPVKLNSEVTGLILISHKAKNIYNDMMVAIVKTLHHHFAIALDNANQYEQLEKNVETDYLTGLPNLKGFAKTMEEFLRARDFDRVSLIVLDLDHFKVTNDTYGHQAGNEVLKQIASILKSFAKDNVCVARYGGEEFVVLLPDYSKEAAESTAEGIRRTIEEAELTISQSIHGKETLTISVTASLGVATYPVDCHDAEELIALADKAMYIGSKQRGRNRVTAAQKGNYRHAD